MRTKSTEEQSEATKSQMDDVSVRPHGDHDLGCVQEESSATPTAAPPSASRAYGFALGQPEYG